MEFISAELKIRIFLCLLVAITAFTPAGAQRFVGILQGGLNLSQIDGDGLAGYDQPGLAGGLQVNTILSPRWEWSLGIALAQQGARKNALSSPSAAFQRIRLNTVELPVMIHFNEWKFQLGAGIAFNRLIRARVVDITGTDVSSQQNLRDNHFSGLLECKVFLRENAGFGLRWYKNLFNIKSDPASGAWIGRSIQLHGFLRL